MNLSVPIKVSQFSVSCVLKEDAGLELTGDIRPWIPPLRGGVEENRIKRCLKGGGVDSGTPGGGGFVLVCQGVSRTNICGN